MNDTSSDDILLLKQRLAEQEALIHALQEKLSNREREIDHLQAQLDKLRRMNFGSRSEKVSRRIAQMEADLNLLQQESDTLTGRVDDPAVQRPLRQTRTRKPFPESLPRDEKRLLPTEPCCPECGGSLSYLGEDAAEQLELMRSAFRVIRTVREKHACRRCDRIVQAPAPSRPIERGIAGPGLLPGNKKTKTGRLWTYVRDDRNAGSALAPAVWFAYSPDRKGIHPQTHLAGFSGVLQADAYAGFNELYRDGHIKEAACWAHARRKIHDVHVRTPSALTEEALKRIGELYAIESELRGKRAEERQEVRHQKVLPLLASLYSLIGTCKLNGVDPERYLHHVLDVIADWPVNRVGALLPWRVTLPA
ncbi:IS66 family transposase [Escherichia coli]|nr:transposase [Escherichia coli]EHX2057447.1 IS66 family transposase [Escherichia coli]EIE2976151.1 IS66 family transposase [Escherichia coli]EJZ0108794.1 IS66 family transposase [Escherichia coli]EKI1494918.1 IS66 family transposase [Escherichia coli]